MNICERWKYVVRDTLRTIQVHRQFRPSLAGQVWRKLQHASWLVWERCGAAKLRQFSQAHYVNRTALNFHLATAMHSCTVVLCCPLVRREMLFNLLSCVT